MYHSASLAYRQPQNSNAYLINEIMEADQEKLLIKVYDFAIVHAQKGNMEKTNQAIGELISALKFNTPETKEISSGLLRLYQFCQEEMRNKNHEIVITILNDLRKTWIEAFELIKKK